MKKIFWIVGISIAVSLFIGWQSVRNCRDGTSKSSIDFNWYFHLGDLKNAYKIHFDDTAWRKVDLPHDWSIEGAYDRNNPSGWRGAYLPGGIGWYRKYVVWKEGWNGKKVFIEFDGVYMNSEVWINEHYLGKRPYGYISFHYDLTPYLKKGKNVIAVRVDNARQPSCRWYSGSGIYRHVWLHIVPKLHFNRWKTFIFSRNVSNHTYELNIEPIVSNQTAQPQTYRVVTKVFAPFGGIVASAETPFYTLSPDSVATINQTVKIYDPKLWSPNSPNLYAVKNLLLQGECPSDSLTTKIGIRKIAFDPNTGFWLNGKNVKFKGICMHHDAGGVGAAVPDGVLLRRLRLLKKMGCNAIRTSHNPFTPEFYAMCDSLGFLVMDEAFDGWQQPKAKYDYGLYFQKWWRKDLTDCILRDRNHPSVVIWSIGNEVRGRTPEQEKKMVELVHKLDPTRPVTVGGGYSAAICDIAGFNGRGELKGVLEKVHKKHPNWPMIGTELPHTWQTRGVYRTKTWIRGRDFPAPWAPEQMNIKVDTTRIYYPPDLTQREVFTGINPNYFSSYDNATVRISSRKQWERTKSLDFFMGEFRWTGFDYLGENRWPNRGSHAGILDLCGFPKDTYYFYLSEWTKKPMIHLFPLWTIPGKKGIKIPVMVYTNCETVELFLNGNSLGIKAKVNKSNLLWYVPYSPGTLEAVGRIKGQVVCRTKSQTAGEPYKIELTADREDIKANNRDVVHITTKIVDKKGIMVPYADNLIRFKISGPGKLIALDNGDMLDLTSTKINKKKVFNGLCLAIIQSTDRGGKILVTAQSEGLKSATMLIHSKSGRMGKGD